jgi:hypothetical protein
MILGIVIPLKSKQISKNWEITSRSLQRTLNSIVQQTQSNFQVVVCGHDKPDFLSTAEYSQIKFVSVNSPVPDRDSLDFGHHHLIQDKNIKIVTGMHALRSANIDYWYQLDSDDVLHENFLTNLASLDGYAGAVIDGGYIVYSEQQRVIETSEMSQYCGSTCIIADKFIDIPDIINSDSIKQIPWVRYPHMEMAAYFKDELKQPHLQISVLVLGYILATGDNISDKWRDSPLKVLKEKLRPYIKGKKLSRAIKTAFAIE